GAARAPAPRHRRAATRPALGHHAARPGGYARRRRVRPARRDGRQPARAPAPRAFSRAHGVATDHGGGLTMRLWRRRGRHADPLVCREFVELVTDYLEGTLPEPERVRFEAHLAECDGCSGYLEDMRRLVGSLRVVPEPPPDPATREALVRASRDLREPGWAAGGGLR